jgi:transposase-like protein
LIMSSKQTKSNKERQQFWQMAIETWQASGLSVSKFCKAEGLSEGAFYSWRKRLCGRQAEPNKQTLPSPSAFIEVAMPKPALSLSNGNDHVPLELLLSSGHTLRIRSAADNETLSAVMSVLRQVGLC